MINLKQKQNKKSPTKLEAEHITSFSLHVSQKMAGENVTSSSTRLIFDNFFQTFPFPDK